MKLFKPLIYKAEVHNLFHNFFVEKKVMWLGYAVRLGQVLDFKNLQAVI
jgi:hypothetical protein